MAPSHARRRHRTSPAPSAAFAPAALRAIPPLLLVLLLVDSGSAGIGRHRPEERAVLVSLYETCDGPSWTTSTSWLSETVSHCMWYGITCADDTGRISDIELSNNNLYCVDPGVPPEVLSELPRLRTLDLGGNQVDMEFPDLGEDTAKNLKYLKLNMAAMTDIDGIGDAIGPGLRSLDLADNRLNGPFPKEVMYSFPNLRNLDLSRNFYTGDLPEDMGQKKSKLKTLLLADNFLEGQIPLSVKNFKKASIVDMSDNMFHGALPPGMEKWSRLTFLSLRNQNPPSNSKLAGISGPVPPFSTHPRLYWLDLAFNALSGPVPPNLLAKSDKYSQDTQVDLSSNDISGPMPTALTRFAVLRLQLADNRIDDVPAKLCTSAGDWFLGQVGDFGCDAILCPPGKYNEHGRQVSRSTPCEVCPRGTLDAPYYGSVGCGSSGIRRSGNTASSFAPRTKNDEVTKKADKVQNVASSLKPEESTNVSTSEGTRENDRGSRQKDGEEKKEDFVDARDEIDPEMVPREEQPLFFEDERAGMHQGWAQDREVGMTATSSSLEPAESDASPPLESSGASATTTTAATALGLPTSGGTTRLPSLLYYAVIAASCSAMTLWCMC